jgi:hypothetical protein
MTPTKLGVVLATVLAAGACHYETQTVVPTAGLTTSEQACIDYGFTPGTGAYNRCVSREHEARVRGRVARDYAQALLAADARDACYSYGLEPGTARYDRCIGREIDARRYREDAASYVPPPAGVYPARTYPSAPYVETRNADTAGIQVFRDEYGFRYDAQGNRLDRNGNIISPQSTQP